MTVKVSRKKIIQRMVSGIAAVIVASGFLGELTEAVDNQGEFLQNFIAADEVKAEENIKVMPQAKGESKQFLPQETVAVKPSENSAGKQADAGSPADAAVTVYDADMKVIPMADLGKYKGETVYLEIKPGANNQQPEKQLGKIAADSALKIKVEWTNLPGDCREQAVSAVQAALISIEDNPVVGYGLENGVIDKILVCEVGVESAQEHPWNIID